MSFSVAAVDELNPCFYNILRTTEVHIFQSIHYLDRLQFFNARMILSSIKPQKSPAWAAGPFKPHSWKNPSINAVNHCRQRQQPKLHLERQEFQFQQWVDTSLLPAWRATIKHEKVAIACILQAIATSLTGGVHAFLSSLVVDSTVDGLSLHPGGVQRTDVFFRNLLGKSGEHQQCTHQESRRQTDDSFQDESIGGASTA